jgi:N-acetylmuramoyl-L-alanine amidase
MKICIDPGHGGKDPGAVGPTGLEEATVALQISLDLAADLESFGWSVALTRSTDVFIELGARCEIANDWGADYFISIHCNSNGPEAVGIETLYKTDSGKLLAIPVQDALITATDDRDRGLKYRDNLYVLNGTRMPAILVEVGFISNPDTEKNLGLLDYQTLLADAIALGLENHVKTNQEADPT